MSYDKEARIRAMDESMRRHALNHARAMRLVMSWLELSGAVADGGDSEDAEDDACQLSDAVWAEVRAEDDPLGHARIMAEHLASVLADQWACGAEITSGIAAPEAVEETRRDVAQRIASDLAFAEGKLQ